MDQKNTKHQDYEHKRFYWTLSSKIDLTCPHHSTTSTFNSLPFINSVGLVIIRKRYCCAKTSRIYWRTSIKEFNTTLPNWIFPSCCSITNLLEISSREAIHNKSFMLQKFVQHIIKTSYLPVTSSQLRQ